MKLVCLIENISIFLVFGILCSCTRMESHTLDAITGFDTSNNPLIIGGQEVQKEEELARHIVGIAHPEYGIFCTGVLVSKNTVLTAAHCTDFEAPIQDYVIVFGNDLENDFQLRTLMGGKTTAIWPSLTNEDYFDPTIEWGDLALLKFEGEAPKGYTPVRILGSPSKLFRGADIVIVGYGLTQLNQNGKTKKLMKAKVKLTNPLFNSTEMFLDQYEGRGACKGDSGGPAFTINDKNLYLIGIASRAARLEVNDLCSVGSIYSNVSRQLNFIYETIQFLNSSNFIPGQSIPQPK